LEYLQAAVALTMLEIFISPYKYRDKPNNDVVAGTHAWLSFAWLVQGGLCPNLTEPIIDIWWAQPTLR